MTITTVGEVREDLDGVEDDMPLRCVVKPGYPMFASIVIAYLLEAVVSRLQRLGIPRMVAVILVFLLFLTVLFFILFGLILLVSVVLLIMGLVFEALSMVLIMTPVLLPAAMGMRFDPIWFGVIIVMTVELGLITPPVGMNVFIMKGVAGDVPLGTIFRGIFPFLIADFARLITLISFPALSLFLPQLLR